MASTWKGLWLWRCPKRSCNVKHDSRILQLLLEGVVVSDTGGADQLETELRRIHREETKEEYVRQKIVLEKLLSN